MPRPTWKGHISFGLVNIPVNVYPAEQRTDLQLHMIDSRDQSRVRYERVNEETGEEVPWDQVVRGYEYSSGNYVVLSDEELKRAAPEATKRVDIEAFVPLKDIDTAFFDKPYYLEPGKGGEKGYVLLREALRDTERVGIARVVIRTRQYIAALAARKDLLMLDLLRYAQEIRSAEDLAIPRGAASKHGVTPAELKMAKMLVDTMAAEWKPESYQDEYRSALMKWIKERIKAEQAGKTIELPPEVEDVPHGPINFIEAMKQSLEQKGRKHAPAKAAGGERSSRGKAAARSGRTAAKRGKKPAPTTARAATPAKRRKAG